MGWPQGGDEVLPSQTAATRCVPGCRPPPYRQQQNSASSAFLVRENYLLTSNDQFKQDKAIVSLRACREAEHSSVLPVGVRSLVLSCHSADSEDT